MRSRRLLVVLLGDEEVLLLGADGGGHAVGRVVAEQVEHAAALRLDGLHGAQKRRLLVQRLAGVGAEGRGDAEHLVLDKGVGGGVPRRVAAGLEGGAQAAGGEAGGVGLALDELLAGERHDGAAVVGGVDEAVVLLGGDARQRLEPVGVVGGALLDGPLLHGVGDDVGHVLVQRRALLDGLHQLLVGGLGQTLAHDVLVEHHGAVQIGHFRHNGALLTRVDDRNKIPRRSHRNRCAPARSKLTAHCFEEFSAQRNRSYENGPTGTARREAKEPRHLLAERMRKSGAISRFTPREAL